MSPLIDDTFRMPPAPRCLIAWPAAAETMKGDDVHCDGERILLVGGVEVGPKLVALLTRSMGMW